MAHTINDLQEQINDNADLEEIARDISRASTSAPTAATFTAFSETIPDGYIWLDKDSSAGVGYYAATSVYTATAPSTNLANGLIWIEKGSSPLTMYVWNADTENWDEIGA